MLDAAAAVFIDRGIGAASVEEIAEAAGFSRGAFYSNFADKDEIVLALLERMSQQSVAEIEQLMVDHPDPDDYVRATQAMLRQARRRREAMAITVVIGGDIAPRRRRHKISPPE